MLTWRAIERALRAAASIDGDGDGWLVLHWNGEGGAPVAVRVERLDVAGIAHVGVVTGGASVDESNLTRMLARNALFPPGCTVLLHGGQLWLRFLMGVERLELANVLAMVAFVAREGGELFSAPASERAEAPMFYEYAM